MPLEAQTIAAREFIRLNPDGRLDLDGSRAVLQALAETYRKRGKTRAMLDVREVRTDLTLAELAALVDAFCEMGFSESQRLAVLHSGDQNHPARLFASISKLRGWRVRPFDKLEDAVGWLALTDEVTNKKFRPSAR
jgi:hypothetical protein